MKIKIIENVTIDRWIATVSLQVVKSCRSSEKFIWTRLQVFLKRLSKEKQFQSQRKDVHAEKGNTHVA